MKKNIIKYKTQTYFIVLVFLFQGFMAQAQSEEMPNFSILLTNGKTFDIKKEHRNKPFLLIYFAPDCDHCQTLMNSFFKQPDDFKNLDVFMVTFKPLNDVAKFEKLYQTNKYPNIKVGSEKIPLYLKMFYKLENTPFTALYTKDGILSYSYKKETPIRDLVRRVKSIK